MANSPETCWSIASSWTAPRSDIHHPEESVGHNDKTFALFRSTSITTAQRCALTIHVQLLFISDFFFLPLHRASTHVNETKDKARSWWYYLWLFFDDFSFFSGFLQKTKRNISGCDHRENLLLGHSCRDEIGVEFIRNGIDRFFEYFPNDRKDQSENPWRNREHLRGQQHRCWELLNDERRAFTRLICRLLRFLTWTFLRRWWFALRALFLRCAHCCLLHFLVEGFHIFEIDHFIVWIICKVKCGERWLSFEREKITWISTGMNGETLWLSLGKRDLVFVLLDHFNRFAQWQIHNFHRLIIFTL